jgi:hypothetical protein
VAAAESNVTPVFPLFEDAAHRLAPAGEMVREVIVGHVDGLRRAGATEQQCRKARLEGFQGQVAQELQRRRQPGLEESEECIAQARLGVHQRSEQRGRAGGGAHREVHLRLRAERLLRQDGQHLQYAQFTGFHRVERKRPSGRAALDHAHAALGKEGHRLTGVAFEQQYP